MAPFDCGNILYRRHHKLVNEQYNIGSIAEAVVNWGICDDFDFIEEYYQSEELEHIDVITTTVSNFLHFFEVDFQQIISKHCNENRTKEQFATFVCNICNRLGKISAYFGYIMPCAFMREAMWRFKYDFQSSNVFVLAQECLEKFLVKKFREFENDISWNGFLSYCKDINSQFSEKIHFEDQIFEQFADEELYLVPINIIENLFPTVKSTDGKDEPSNTIMPLEALPCDMTNSNHMSGNRNNEKDNLSKFSDGTFMQNTKLDGPLDISQHSLICFEYENNLYRTRDFSKSYVCFHDASSDTSSNDTCAREVTVDTFISKTKSDKTEDLAESMSVLYPELEHGSSISEENNSTNGVGSRDISSVTRCSTETTKEEFNVLFNILIPDDEFAVEVFNCLSECLDFDEEEKLDTS